MKLFQKADWEVGGNIDKFYVHNFLKERGIKSLGLLSKGKQSEEIPRITFQ